MPSKKKEIPQPVAPSINSWGATAGRTLWATAGWWGALYLTAWYVGSQVSDVAGPMWSGLGSLAFPIFLGIFLFVDRRFAPRISSQVGSRLHRIYCALAGAVLFAPITTVLAIVLGSALSN
jgi:hypothetical protein